MYIQPIKRFSVLYEDIFVRVRPPLGEQNTTYRVKINPHIQKKSFDKVFIKWALMQKVILKRKLSATEKSYARSLLAS